MLAVDVVPAEAIDGDFAAPFVIYDPIGDRDFEADVQGSIIAAGHLHRPLESSGIIFSFAREFYYALAHYLNDRLRGLLVIA